MRYLIISYDDYFNIPYIQYYEKNLQAQNQQYDIVLWSRSGQPVDMSNAFVFYGQDCKSKIGKIKPFLQWRRFVLDVLKKHSYDRLIILTTIPAVLLADVLLTKYRNKYWLDIRDYTYERFMPYKHIVKNLVFGASHVSISSPAFQNFLPASKNILLTHNISNQEFIQDHCAMDPAAKSICIGYVGGVQFEQQNQQLLRQLANHPRYCLKYAGKAHLGCDLPVFCSANGILNVEFQPAFQNSEKSGIYQGIQLINCIYGDDNPVVRLLLPNRLYDCVLFKKPILVSKNTYLAQVVAQYHLGLALDTASDNISECLDTYLSTFDTAAFEEGCRSFLQQTEAELHAYAAALRAFCSDTYSC